MMKGIFCRETAISRALVNSGYNPLSVPRAGIEVGDLFFLENKNLEKIGNFSNLFDGSKEDIVSRNNPVVEFEGVSSSKIDLDTSLKYINELFKSLNVLEQIDPSYDLKFSEKSKAKFRFQNVTEDSIDLFRIDKLMSSIQVNSLPLYFKSKLLSNNVYIAVAILKSKSIELKSLSDSNLNVSLQVNREDKTVSVCVGESEVDKKTFNSNSKITFALKAYKIRYNSGFYSFEKSKRTFRSSSPNKKNLLVDNVKSRFIEL